MQLGRTRKALWRILRIERRKVQRRGIVVCKLHRLGRHELREDPVHSRKHARTAAVVLREVDACILLAQGRILALLLEEELRVGKTKAIDALLDVADGKEVVITRDEGENRLLHAVRVLILVNHDFLILLAQGERLRRGAKLSLRRILVAEDGEREMLQVVEIDDAALLLRRLKRGGEILDDIDDGMSHARKSAKIVEKLLFRRMKIRVPELFETLFHAIARLRKETLRLLLFLLVHAFWEAHPRMSIRRERLAQSFPIPCRQGVEQVFKDFLVPLQCSMARLIAERRRLLDEPLDSGETGSKLKGNLREHGLRPRRIEKTLLLCEVEALSERIEPARGKGLTARKGIEAQYHGIESFIAVLRTVSGGKGKEILLRFVILFFKDFFERILLQQTPLLLVCKTKLRIEVDDGKVAPNDVLAEGVKRRNRGVEKERQLALKFRRRRALGDFLRESRFDALAHLGGSGVREGDDEKAIDVRLPLQDAADDALDEHRGLARSGGRRDEQILAPFLDRPQLCRRPFACVAHSASSCPFNSMLSINSASSWLCSRR